MLAEWEQCLGPIAAGLHHLLETSSAFPRNACLVLRLVLRHFGTILVENMHASPVVRECMHKASTRVGSCRSEYVQPACLYPGNPV